MLRAHCRTRSLKIVLQQLEAYQDFADVKIHALLDRPTPEVRELVHSCSLVFAIMSSPDPLVSPGGLTFREAKAAQLDAIGADLTPDWILLQDDDRWFEPLGAAEELPLALADDDVDMWYARSWFVWDRSDQINLNRFHNSPVLFRWDEEQEFPLNRDIQAPLPLHDEAIIQVRTGTFKTPLLDYGTFDEAERKRVFDEFLAAGKDDPYVRSIMKPPHLVSIDSRLERPWRDLWKESCR
jgi:hypothetical protein